MPAKAWVQVYSSFHIMTRNLLQQFAKTNGTQNTLSTNNIATLKPRFCAQVSCLELNVLIFWIKKTTFTHSSTDNDVCGT